MGRFRFSCGGRYRNGMPPPLAGDRSRSKRTIAALAVVVAAGLALWVSAVGWLGLEWLVVHGSRLDAAIARAPALAALAYILVYLATVALYLPGAGVLSIAGGALFGTVYGPPIVYVAGLLGGCAAFGTARTALGTTLAERAGGRVERLAAGLRLDAFNYVLFLRLVPLVPFWLVNLAPPILGVSFRDYARATALGILPGAAAFALAGAGLDSALRAERAALAACRARAFDPASCRIADHLAVALTPELAVGLVALGLLALVPVAVRRWRRWYAPA